MIARLRQPNSVGRVADVQQRLDLLLTERLDHLLLHLDVRDAREGVPAQAPIRVHQEKKARVSRKRRCRVPRETPLSAMTLRKA